MKEERIQRATIALKVQDSRVVEYVLREIFEQVDIAPFITSVDEFLAAMFIQREDIQPVIFRHISDLLLAIIPDSTNSKGEIQIALNEIKQELGLNTQSGDSIENNTTPTFDKLTNQRNPEL